MSDDNSNGGTGSQLPETQLPRSAAGAVGSLSRELNGVLSVLRILR